MMAEKHSGDAHNAEPQPGASPAQRNPLTVFDDELNKFFVEVVTRSAGNKLVDQLQTPLDVSTGLARKPWLSEEWLAKFPLRCTPENLPGFIAAEHQYQEFVASGGEREQAATLGPTGTRVGVMLSYEGKTQALEWVGQGAYLGLVECPMYEPPLISDMDEIARVYGHLWQGENKNPARVQSALRGLGYAMLQGMLIYSQPGVLMDNGIIVYGSQCWFMSEKHSNTLIHNCETITRYEPVAPLRFERVSESARIDWTQYVARKH